MLEMFHLQNISRLNIHNRPVFHRTLWTLLHIYVIYIIYTIYIYTYIVYMLEYTPSFYVGGRSLTEAIFVHLCVNMPWPSA